MRSKYDAPDTRALVPGPADTRGEDGVDELTSVRHSCECKPVAWDGFEHPAARLPEFDDRLVAVASMFEWRGFSDLGVLTVPELRRRGTGKAVVSAMCERLLDGPRVVVYRYSLDNLGSAGVARSLALAPLGVTESVRPDEGA